MPKAKPKIYTFNAAMAYLGVSRRSVYNYIDKGILQVQTNSAGKKFFYESDLQKLRLVKPRPVIPVSENTETKELSLFQEKPTVEIRLQEEMNVPPEYTVKQGQQLIRSEIIAMAKANKIVQKLFDLVNDPDPNVGLKAIKVALDKVLPNLQSVDMTQSLDEEAKQQNDRIIEAMKWIHEDIHKSRLPVIDTELVQQIQVIEVENETIKQDDKGAN